MTALPLVQPRRRTGGAGASGFLATLAGFDDRHRAAVEELSEFAEARRVRRGEVLWREGDVSDCVVVVRSGVVLQRRAIASHAVALDVCGRGAFLGLAGARRDHEAVMHEDGTLFVIRRADFEAWVVEHPAVAIASTASTATNHTLRPLRIPPPTPGKMLSACVRAGAVQGVFPGSRFTPGAGPGARRARGRSGCRNSTPRAAAYRSRRRA